MSLISYAGCLGLSLVISAKLHFLNVRRSLKSQKNSVKAAILSISRSLKVILKIFTDVNFRTIFTLFTVYFHLISGASKIYYNVANNQTSS